MLSNFGKGMCLYVRYGNDDAQYTMGGIVLSLPVKKTGHRVNA